MNLYTNYTKLREAPELLLWHLLDLASLIAILVLTTFVLLGWGHLAARWIGLPRVTAIRTLEIWLGFAVVVGLVELVHLISPVDWKVSLTVVLIGFIGVSLGYLGTWRLYVPALARFVLAWPWTTALIALVFAVLCSLAMSPPANYDSGLYHFSSIRWLNEYPIVPGLGNLHAALASNQSYFGFVALLNVAPIWNKGYAVGGVFLLLLCATYVLEAGLYRLKGGIWIIGLLSVVIACREGDSLSSPTPDLTVNLLQVVIFLILARHVMHHEKPDKSIVLYDTVLLLLTGVVIVTTKLSGAMYGLTSMIIGWPLLMKELVKHRMIAVKVLALCIAVGTIHALRGYVLSGVPFFPSTFAGAWHLDWAMPIEAVEGYFDVIYNWARMPHFPPEVREQVVANWQWFGFWLKAFPVRGWLTLGSAFALTLLNLYLTWLYRMQYCETAPYVLYVPLVTSVVFWFATAPDLRYLGFIPELLVILSVWILICGLQNVGQSCLPSLPEFGRPLQRTLAIAVVLMILTLAGHKSISLCGFQPIPTASTQIKITDSGLHVHVPVTGDQCWNAPLPCTPIFNPMLRGRWDNLSRADFSAGFALKVKNS